MNCAEAEAGQDARQGSCIPQLLGGRHAKPPGWLHMGGGLWTCAKCFGVCAAKRAQTMRGLWQGWEGSAAPARQDQAGRRRGTASIHQLALVSVPGGEWAPAQRLTSPALAGCSRGPSMKARS